MCLCSRPRSTSLRKRVHVQISLAKSRSKLLGSMWPISSCQDTDVSSSQSEMGRRLWVPKAEIQPTPQPLLPNIPSQRL